MSEPLKSVDFLDNWIKTQAFKYAFNEKTRGFIGKKFIRERIISTIPREFIARGLTKEKVSLRLAEMLANDLTQSLVRDCDEKRIRASEAEASATRNLIAEDFGVIGDRGVLITSAPVTISKPSTSYIPFIPSSIGAGHGSAKDKAPGFMPSTSGFPGISANITGVGPSSAGVPGICNAESNKGSIGIMGRTIGAGSIQINGYHGRFSNGEFGSIIPGSSIQGKGKGPMTMPGEAEDTCEGVAISAPSGSKNKVVSLSQSPAHSVSDVDRTIADFVAAKSSEARLKISPKPAIVENSKDIFSRGGSSTPPKSGSPASSDFIGPPTTPSLPSDPEIPSLPFKHQHRILTSLQNILEGAYYEFARKYYPNLLARKGWDCPEAGELTQWTRGLAFEFRQNPTKAVREAEGFTSALKETDEIRHSAVHRVPVSGKDIQRLIESSKVIVHILEDTKRTREINEIHAVIEKNIKIALSQRRKKEEKLRVELEKLEEWKRILELREMRAIKQAEHEEERIQRLFRDEVGRALDLVKTEEGAECSVAVDVESVGSVNKESEPACSESEVENNVQSSSLEQQEEEYFHESEGWPVGIDNNSIGG